MFKDFPSLHPLAVHFPIVLIVLGAVFQSVVVWKDWKQIHWTTLFILAGAFFSGLAAATILHAEPSADAPKAAMEMFEQHEKYAQLTLWMSGITLLLKSIGVFFEINRRIYDVIVLTAAIVATIFVSITGHHGARLTHVAGVGPMGRYLMKDHHGKEEEGMKDMNGMEMKSDSAVKMNDKMPGMDTMKNMKGMDSKSDTSNMKDMSTKEMDNMKDMPGMGKMKSGKGMESKKDMKDMKEMKNMPGMDTMKNMKSPDSMKNMSGMDSTMNMSDMKNMKMPAKNTMDTFRFPDNNPGLKKSKKPNKR